MSDTKIETQGLIKKIMSNKLFVSSTFIMAVSVFVGLLNFIFNILMSNMLGPEKYGIVQPLVSLTMMISIPMKALMYVMTKDFSELVVQDQKALLQKYLRSLTKWVLIINIVYIGFLFIFMPALKSYMHIDNNYGFYLIFLLIFLSAFSAPFNSLIQSRERFFKAGIGQILNAAVKFVVAYVIVKQTLEYYGVLWGIVAGVLSALLVFGLDSLNLKREIKNAVITKESWKKTADAGKIIKSFLLAFASIGFFQLFIYFDTVLVLHFLPEQSGVYAVVKQMGLATFFIATGVSFVILPMMSKEKGSRTKSNLKGLIFLMVFLGLYVAGITLFKNFIASYLFQGKYIGLEKMLPIYTIMFVPYAAISYMVNYYFLSQKLFYSVLILIGVILQVTGIYLFHADLVQVAVVVGVTGYLVFLILLLDFFIIHRKYKMSQQNDKTISPK